MEIGKQRCRIYLAIPLQTMSSFELRLELYTLRVKLALSTVSRQSAAEMKQNEGKAFRKPASSRLPSDSLHCAI